MKTLIVIPAYNEEANIVRVIETLKKDYARYDYVIINDGSKDRTAEICRQRGYSMIDLPINLGLAGAFQTGLKYAYQKGYDYAMQFDADGQHLPEYIDSMMEEMQRKGYDIVIGSRFVTEKKPRTMRMMGNNLISWAIRLTTGVQITDPTSGMRLFNKNMIQEFATNINYGPEPDTISFLLKQGIKVGEVQVNMAERIAGESYLTAAKSIIYMTKMMISIIVLQNFRRRSDQKTVVDEGRE